MWHAFCHTLFHGLLQAQNTGGQLMLRRRTESPDLQIGNRVFGNVTADEDTLDARIGVLQIWRSIALKRHHGLPIEYVIAGSIFRQIGILDGSYANSLGRLLNVLCRAELARTGDRLAASFTGFIQQIRELHNTALAGFEGFAISSEHGTKGIVLEADPFRIKPCRTRNRVDLPEMQHLACIGEHHDAIGL